MSFDFRFWKRKSAPIPFSDDSSSLDRPLLLSSAPTYNTFNDDLPLIPPSEYDSDEDDHSPADLTQVEQSRSHDSPQSIQANLLDETPSTWRNFVNKLKSIQKKEEQHQLNVSRGLEHPSSPLQVSSSETSITTSPIIQSPIQPTIPYSTYQNPSPISSTNTSSSGIPLENNPAGLNVSQRRVRTKQHPEPEPKFSKDSVIKTIKHKLRTAQKRAPYYIPILGWLPRYQRSNLSGDIVAGITTGIMLIPQGMAYAFLVGIPSIHGLYTGLIPVLVYCFFGTSKQLSVGPEAAVSLIVGTTLKQISAANDVPLTTSELIDMSIMLSFIVGIFSLALGLLRFGFLSEVLSRPLIRGFILAIALTIILDQLDTLLGLTGITGSGWRKVVPIFKAIHNAQPIAYGMSIGAIAALFIMNKLKKMIPERRTKIIHHIGFFIPSILVVVVIGISVTKIFRLGDKGLAVLGYQEASFPKPRVPPLNQWSLFTGLLSPGLFITIVGFVESMAISKILAAKHNYQVSTNRELVAIGMSNLAGSVFLAYPMFASMTRSVVNDKAGARSQLAGFVTFIIILFTCLFLMPVFYHLPRVIMSSIVFVAAIGLIELHDIIFLWKVRAWMDLFLLLLTFVTTFIFSTEVGLIVSIGMSCFMVIKQSSAPQFSVLGRMPESCKYKDITLFTEARPVEGLIIIRFDESIYFSNVGQVKEILLRIEKLGSAMAHPSEAEGGQEPLKGVVFDMRNIPVIDASSIQILHEIVSNYEKRDITVTFVKLKDSLKAMFLRGGFYDLIGTDRFFSNIHEAVIRVLGGPPRTHSSYFTTQILVPNEQPSEPPYLLSPNSNNNNNNHNYSLL